jgi:hypothetical protein
MATLRDGCGPPHRRYSQALIGPAGSNFFSPLIPMPMQLVLTTTARALRCAAGHQPAAGGGDGAAAAAAAAAAAGRSIAGRAMETGKCCGPLRQEIVNLSNIGKHLWPQNRD